MSYAILRIEKIKSEDGVKKVIGHASRRAKVTNASGNKKDVTMIADLPVSKYLEEIEGLKRKKNSTLGLDVFLGASPEFFKEGGGNLEAWTEDNVKWLHDTFGRGNVKVIALHRDEMTPHIQAVVLPKDEGKLNAAKWIDGPAKLKKLQDSYGEAMRPHGLERGIKGSQAKHTDIKEFYAAVNEIKKMDLPMPKIKEEGRFFIQEREETASEYLQRTGLKIKAGKTTIQQQIREIDNLKRSNSKVTTELNEIKEAQKLETAQLREIDLNNIMITAGFEKDVKGSDKKRSVYHLEDGKISVQGAKWYDFLDQKGGGGAIDLVMRIFHTEFRLAVAWLKRQYSTPDIQRVARQHVEKIVETAPKAKITMEERDDSKLDVVRQYLKDRGIDEKLIDSEIKAGKIYANKYGSAVFVHRDPLGIEVKGYSVRGTTGRFKQRVGGGYYWVGATPHAAKKVVVLTESAIDALSYYQLRSYPPDTCVLALSGHATPAPELVREIENKEVVIALDNPTAEKNTAARAAGKLAIEKIKEVLPGAIIETPKAKDWNDDLLGAMKNQKELTITNKTTQYVRPAPGR